MAACRPLEALYQKYKDRVTFVLIYIDEAHPGQILSVPGENGDKELGIIPVISTIAESLANMRRLVKSWNLTIPTFIDTPDKATNGAYAAYPNRIYTVTPDGKVAYKGAPGPTGLKVDELESWLKENIKSSQ